MIRKLLYISLLGLSLQSFAQDKQATLPIEELKTFNDVFLLIKQNYVDDISDAELINSAIKGMLSELDPHSTFLTRNDYTNLESSTTGRFGGVGLEVTMDNGFIKVISPIANTPAAEAGIQSGDLIIRIDEKSIQGLDLDDAVELMRGEPNTKVNFTVIREGNDVPLNFELTRQYVKTASVRSRHIEGGYGYIYISQFQLPTGNDVRQAIGKLQNEKNINGLVLDLRNNPGGVLTGAINVSDAFLNKGVIVSTKGRTNDSRSLVRATPGDVLNGKPIVVLINSGSASASEIVAGALQDNKRAIIMGTTSFGKGSVQNIMELSNNSAVKLTTARYYTPSDKSIQAKGIVPDIIVKPLELKDNARASFTVSEASLKGHLDNTADKDKRDKKSNDDNLATQDYVLYEALNILKALNVVSSQP